MSVVFNDLDKCISYLINFVPNYKDEVAQVLNTIRHFISEISDGKLIEQDVQQHFTKLKKIMLLIII